MRRPGVEPGSTAWKAAIIAVIPPTLLILAVLLDFNKEYLYQSLQLAYTNQSRRECFFIIETMAKCAIIFVMLFCHGQREMNLYSYTVVWMIAILCLLNGLLLAKISSFHLLNEHLFSLMISWQCRFQFQRSRKPSFHHKLYRYFPPINEIKRNFFIQSVAKNPIGFTCGRYFRITKLKYIELQLMNESVFVAGQLCFDLLGFAYTGHFFLRKFKNFVQVFRENQQSIINRNLVLKKYCREYLKQSFEIALMNRTARDCFFIIEMVSKVTIVFAMLFFEDQSKINIYSLTVMLVIVFFFLINATLLARVSSFESLNLSYYRSMLTWQNRNRFRSFVQKSRFHYDLGSINEIRRNFFTQTISTNPIGFDCGRIFHVTKLKYIELQFMNCVLLLLFYKRFLL
ncbi:hypothetical protein SSS_07494 [Sarcoptes scabiei]|uniref:Uncharacterized protein n=1 Tax=Sarcoptes scabiei TaxID=52283 RepID=A0A834VGZ6_SARSC|nr:hypothetical protein SSS_07494 [Sarcoptes scabiei]